MKKKSGSLFKEDFWKVLLELTNAESGQRVSVTADKLKVPQADVEKGIIFLQQLNYPLLVEDRLGEKWITKQGEGPTIKAEFSLLEWISLQAYFPVMADNSDNPFYEIVSQKLAEIEVKNQKHDLYSTAESLVLVSGGGDSSVISMFNEYLPIVEESILKQNVLNINLNGKGGLDIFPHRIVHLEGSLRIVGEDVNDQSLITLDLDLIESIKPSDNDYKANYTVIEVNEFISGFREVSGNEIRLILKVTRDDEQLDLSPSYHFLGDPYITTNSNGDTIWAASIEPCDDLVMWLADLGDRVEVLDPLDFRDRVEEFKNWNKKPQAA